MTRNNINLFLFLLCAALPAITGLRIQNACAEVIPTCNLSVSFDLQKNTLSGTAEIIFTDSSEIVVSTGALSIISADFNGHSVEYNKKEGAMRLKGSGKLVIRYVGIFRRERTKNENLENAGVVQGGLIDTEGISLTGNWYPSVKGLAYYRLAAVVPHDFTAISEADEITYKETRAGREYSFYFPHPLNGIDLVAGRYREVRGEIGDIKIYAYFFPEDASLAGTYVEYARKYFEMYNKLLVPYPYKRFSVVENFLPTGYSMPTFTLLGSEVVRLPFIVKTSLGHEITHQWFGNYVYADFSRGNWLEAVTSYLSDHLYQEQQGKGWEYRKKILTDYQSYVSPQKEFPLKDFRERTDFASAAIGYGKGAMLFHMLHNLAGEEAFYRSLRVLIEKNKFRDATWDDVRRSFESEYGKDLKWFFTQWLDLKGVPSIEGREVRRLVLGGTPSASFKLLQRGQVYKLKIPLKIMAGKKEAARQTIYSEQEKQYFEVPAGEDPETLVLDGDYDVMRRLREDEFPPVISRLLGDEKRFIVYSEEEKGIYEDLISVFRAEGFIPREVTSLKDEDIRTSSLLILGYQSPVLKRLFGEVEKPAAGFVLTVRNNPLNSAKVVAFANGSTKEEVGLAVRKIFHYGQFTTIRFERGENVKKETAETDRGMIFDLVEPMKGVAPARSLGLERIIDNIADKPVIFVGERHSNYEDHVAELDIVMGLHREGRKFAIGMEMFQRPFQKAIDEFMSGAIGERDFLKKSEYFKRWGFDYSLYREVLEFAKAKKIPVVALNLRSEIVDKVAKEGLDSLSPEQMKEIPHDMDMSDAEYKKRLQEIFKEHPSGTTFDNFYQSQILWDETMAHSAAQYLKEHPDSQLVVLAGEEHIMYDSGIPQRLKRLTGKEYVTLINGAFDEEIGSYVIFAAQLEPPFSAKLGVILEKKDGSVVVKDFAPDSAAEKAGLQKGDILMLIDDWKIATVEDARIALSDRRPYESVRVRVIRKKFMFIKQELDFRILL